MDISGFADFLEENLVNKVIEYVYDEMKEEYSEQTAVSACTVRECEVEAVPSTVFQTISMVKKVLGN